MNPGETCDQCAHFEDSPGVPKGGFCHCHPPTVAMMMTANGLQPAASAFPPTQYTSWCGEWKKGSLVKLANKIPPVEPGRN